MLEILTTITWLIFVISAPILLIVFRTDIGRLVSWIVSFKQIAKTKDGFAILPHGEAESAPQSIASKEDVAIAALTETTPLSSAPSADGGDSSDDWNKAYSERRYIDALRLLDEEIDSEPDKTKRMQLRGFRGHVLFEQSAAEGFEYFESLIKEYPTQSPPYAWYALTLMWKGLTDKALAVVDRGLEASTEKASLFETRSDVLRAAARTSEAYAASLDGVRVDPAFLQNYLDLSTLESERGNKEDARRWLRRALDVSNMSEGILARYAKWLWTNDYHPEALYWLTILVGRYPENAQYLTYQGNAYLSNKFSGLALEAYLKADRIAETKQAWILGNIGNIYNNEKLYARAEEYLKAALSLDPSSQYAMERMTLALKGLDEEAKRLKQLLLEAKSQAVAPLPPLEEVMSSVLPPIVLQLPDTTSSES